MKAFGGRGIWFSGFFFAWAARRGAPPPSVAGKRSEPEAESVGLGGSLNVPGVTFGANAKLAEAAEEGSTDGAAAIAGSGWGRYQSQVGVGVDDQEAMGLYIPSGWTALRFE